MKTIKEVLLDKGFTVWGSAGYERIYLDRDAINKLLGLSADCYNSGNICSATLDGEKISNGYAKSIYDATQKVFYNLSTEKFVIKIEWGSPATRKFAQTLENEFNSLTAEEVDSRL